MNNYVVSRSDRFVLVGSSPGQAVTVQLCLLMDGGSGELVPYQHLLVLPATGAQVVSVFSPGFEGQIISASCQVIAGYNALTVADDFPTASVECRILRGSGVIQNAWSQPLLAGMVGMQQPLFMGDLGLGWLPIVRAQRQQLGSSNTLSLSGYSWFKILGVSFVYQFSASLATRKPRIVFSSPAGDVQSFVSEQSFVANQFVRGHLGPYSTIAFAASEIFNVFGAVNFPILLPPGSLVRLEGDNIQSDDSTSLFVNGEVMSAMDWPNA